MLRIAAFASSVVASMPTVFPRTSPASTSRSNTHVKTDTWVSTFISRRVRDNVEWSGAASVTSKFQKRPQTQRIGHPPRDPPLGGQPFEIAEEQQTEIPARPETRAAHPRRVERRAQFLDEGVEACLLQDPVQTLEERMPRIRRKVRRGHPHRRRLSSRRFLAHRHDCQVYETRSIWSSQNRRLLLQAVRWPSASTACTVRAAWPCSAKASLAMRPDAVRSP